MKNGGDGAFVGPSGGSGASEFGNSKWVWIIVCVFVIALLFIVLYFVFMDGGDDVGDDVGDNSGGGIPVSESVSLIQDEEVEACLEMESFDSDCNLLFSDFEVYGKCLGLGELKDECLYRLAVNIRDNSLCSVIDDSLLKSKCNDETFVVGVF